VLRASGELAWLPYQHVDLESAQVRELVMTFDYRFQRDVSRPCNDVESYEEANDDGYGNPDEVRLGLRGEIVENMSGEI
jgi:hypothetical protein